MQPFAKGIHFITVRVCGGSRIVFRQSVVGRKFLQYAEKKGADEIAALISRATKELRMDLEGVPEEIQEAAKGAFLEKANDYYDENIRPKIIDKLKSGMARAVIFPALDVASSRGGGGGGGGGGDDDVEDTSGEGVQC